MQTQIRNCLTCSVLTLGVLFAAGLGVVLFTNFDGWGIFLGGMLISIGAQLLLGLIFTGAGLLVLRGMDARFDRRRLTLFTVTALFAAGLVLALPLVSWLQQRGLDLLDAVQTLVLVALFAGSGLVVRFIGAQAVRVTGDEPRPYDLPPRPQPAGPVQEILDESETKFSQVMPHTPAMQTDTGAPLVPPAPPAGIALPAPARKGNWKNLYGRLLELVDGDESKARSLIEDERNRAPDADPGIWIETAIRRWLRERGQ